jgi:hypothetical protein
MADRTSLKSGVGIPQVNQKVEPHTGNKINLRSGAGPQAKRFPHRWNEHFKNHNY